MTVTKLIKNKAYEIGFDLVGICDPKPFNYAYNVLKERKQNNKLPRMISNNIELLTDPGMHLECVSSIISVGLSYYHQDIDLKQDASIALYARGRDYHRVMKEKMGKLITYIKKMDKTAAVKSFSDTVPLLEKEIARRAGLGWIGKNNLLINPEYGSYIVLGEILTSLKLDYDNPLENGCGQCRICLEKCPTGALIKPYCLEPDLCISYLTQKKGRLKEEDNKAIGKNLWGCDVCQLNCPYNKNIVSNITNEFKPKLEVNLNAILKFTDFPPNWKQSAINWRGLETIKRNAIIVMANSGKKEYLNYLQKIFITRSSLLKDYAEWASKELRSEQNDLYYYK